MSDSRVELLRWTFERWNAGDLESGLEHATDDVRWYPGDVFPDWDEVYVGKEGVRGFFESFMEPWESIAIEPLEHRVLGDQIAQRVRFRARSNEGVDVDIELGQLWTFRGDLLSCFRGYRSFAEAVEAAAAAA